MNRTVNATSARVHFGEIMRQAKNGAVIVEWGGRPEVVVISKQEHDRLLENVPKADWRKMLEETHELLRKEVKGHQLPDPAEMLRMAREEREDELRDSLR